MDGLRGDETVRPWQGTKPELAMAAVLRGLLPKLPPEAARTARKKPTARALAGYAQRRYVVETGMGSLAAYNGELRPVLEHLLAARLAQRHGVHLYQDPATARALLC